MQDGQTPLHNAATPFHIFTAKRLLEAGAEVMARDKVGSCVAIGRDLSEVCYSHYGKQWFLCAKFFCYILASIM